MEKHLLPAIFFLGVLRCFFTEFFPTDGYRPGAIRPLIRHLYRLDFFRMPLEILPV